MSTGRAEAFSDGVFAVAITVLVFNLLPIGKGTLNATVLLKDAWPQYFAYVVSFITIGIMWMNHHTILAHVVRVDRPLLVINLLLLMASWLSHSPPPWWRSTCAQRGAAPPR